jgi:hypothetical protein
MFTSSSLPGQRDRPSGPVNLSPAHSDRRISTTYELRDAGRQAAGMCNHTRSWQTRFFSFSRECLFFRSCACPASDGCMPPLRLPALLA